MQNKLQLRKQNVQFHKNLLNLPGMPKTCHFNMTFGSLPQITASIFKFHLNIWKAQVHLRKKASLKKQCIYQPHTQQTYLLCNHEKNPHIVNVADIRKMADV